MSDQQVPNLQSEDYKADTLISNWFKFCLTGPATIIARQKLRKFEQKQQKKQFVFKSVESRSFPK